MGKKLKARVGKERRSMKVGRFAGLSERRRSVDRRKPRTHNYFF